MLKNISLGVYYPGGSLLHRLRAKTKALLLLWLTIFLTVANQRPGRFAPYAVAVALVFAGMALSGIAPGHLWRRVRILVGVAFVGAITALLFSGDEQPPRYLLGPINLSYGLVRWGMIAAAIALIASIVALPARRRTHTALDRRIIRSRPLLIGTTLGMALLLWLIRDYPNAGALALGPLPISDEGIWLVITVSVVFPALYVFALLLTMTTTPVAFIDALSALIGPLRRVGLPVDEFALMTLLALRFIPTLIDETDQLIKAQMARGADFSGGPVRERIQNLALLLVPLTRGVLRRAAELAIALEARGYEVEGRRTLLHEAPLGKIDYAAIGVVAAITLGALML
jgi:energy-coupling factor transport system permease protein